MRWSLGLASLAAGVILLGSADSPAKPPKLGPPPVQGDCLVQRPPEGCYYAVRETDFDLSKRILRKGETVTGTGHTVWKESSMQTSGTGLKFIKCSGTPYPGPVTCKWKAVSYTNAWTTGLEKSSNGIGIVVTTGGRYVDGTYYAVVGSDPAVEGFVKDPAGKAVADATISIKGKAGSYNTKTDSTGYYYKFVKKGPYRVSVSKPSKGTLPPFKDVNAHNDATEQADFKLCPDENSPDVQNGAVKGCPQRNVDAMINGDPNKQDANVGDTINYKGTDWDPHGGPIVISHGKKTVRKIKATESFSGNYKVPTYLKSSCEDKLRFEQDGKGKVVKYSTGHSQAIAYAQGDVTADGTRKLKFNDGVCYGERVEAGSDGTFAALSLGEPPSEDDDAVYFGARVVSKPHHISIQGFVANRITLAFLSRKPTLNIPTQYRSSSCDTRNKPGLVVIDQESFDSPLTVDTYTLRDGPMRLNGGVSLRKGVLYVTRDMRLSRTVSGAGVICTPAKLTITSPATWPRGQANKPAIVADGGITIK